MKKLIILAGPSAVGKTTLAARITEGGRAELVRSATTRSPRGDGHDGEYIYLTTEEFIASAEGGGMLEYTEYAGALYGTPMSEIERIEGEGRIPLLVLDLNGVDSIREAQYPALAVYLYDHINILEERLYARYLGDAPTPEGLASFVKRKERNLIEFVNIERIAEDFDLLADNSDLGAACETVLSAYENGVATGAKENAIARIGAMLEEKRGGVPTPPPPPPMI